MIKNRYYSDIDGNELKSISLQPVSTGIFWRTRLALKELVVYHSAYGKIVCRPGTYDGYSIPKPITLFTFGIFQPFMPVVEATLPHDVVCDLQMFTDDQRVTIFEHAYDDAVKQFYNNKTPDRRRDKLIAGVMVGNVLFNQC